MNTLQQAFVNGFVKRAAQYGVDEYAAIELLKQSAFSNEELTSKKTSPLLQALAYGTPIAPIPAAAGLFDELVKHPDLPSKTENITLPALLGGVTGLGGGYLAAQKIHESLGGGGEAFSTLLPLAAFAGSGLLGSGLGAYLGAKNYNSKLDELMKKKAAPNQIETQPGGKTYKQVARNPEHDVAPAPLPGVSAASLNTSRKYRLPIPPGGTTEPVSAKK